MAESDTPEPTDHPTDAASTDEIMIDTPDGPMTFAAWKKKHPVQIPSRRTRGKKLPVKIKRFTDQT